MYWSINDNNYCMEYYERGEISILDFRWVLPVAGRTGLSSIKSSTSVITIIIVITITIGTHELNHINIKVKTY
jgi:hypothetical protein